MGRGRQKADVLLSRPKAEPKTERFVGALALQEAPVFYPTEQEFQDPLQYIAQIRPVAEPFGICRIIPPKSWDPPFALDQQKFSFPTKLQAIHQLQERPAACDADTFKLEYGRYLLKEGRSVGSWPIFDGEELDLCKLFNAVKRHGGFEKVKQEKKWVEVIRMVRPKTTLSSLCMQSSASASLLLCQLYEKYLSGYELYQSSAGSRKQSRTPKRSEPKVKCKGKRGTRKGLPASETDIDPDVVGSGRKRQLQDDVDGSDACQSSKLDQSPERKRVKVEEGLGEAIQKEGRSDQICEQCNSGAHEQMMLLCDRCDRGWHLYCLSPPLSAVPHGNWYCLDCIASERDSFGFSQGQKYSLESFRRMADRFKRKWFGSASVTYSELEKEFWRVVERATAPVEVLYGSDLDVSMYGSGFPRKIDAPAGFSAGSKDLQAWESHVNSPWNLNNFPKLNGSMLRLVDDNIPGVIVPWLYVGMLFSSFCWHYEDHCFYSVNYLHWGEPKTWYSVPGSAAEAFEQVMQKSFPDLFEAQPDLLFQLVTMLNPTVLRESGVPVCTTVQEPRNFVITFPKSYHGGFNHGFNCAEAVNFAPVDWLPFGGFAVDRYRLYHKSAVLSHDELLCVIAMNDGNARSQHCLEEELFRIVATERSEREQLWKAGMVKSCRMSPRNSPEHVGTEEDPECIICRYYLHLSAVVCNCRPGKAVCLQHARQLCECSTSQQRLLYRYTLAELDDLLNVEANECKVEDAPAGARPSRRKPRGVQIAPNSVGMPLSKKVKNRTVRHIELAEAWVAQARTSKEQCPSAAVLEDLLSESEQFLWAGHEMDQVRQLESELATACKWAQDTAACAFAIEQRLQAVGPPKSPRVPLSVAENLIAIQPPCSDENIFKLTELVATARMLQQQIQTALESCPLEIKACQALQQDALRCPFELPELQQIKDIIAHAQSWSERARKLLPTSKVLRNRARHELPYLQQLQCLQSEGCKLSVVVSEKHGLDVVIEQIEGWQGRAHKLLSEAASLQELEEILVEAEGLPVHLPEIELLEIRIGKARDWVLRAQESLSDIQQPDDYDVSIKLLRDLLSAGESLDVYAVMEVKVVQKELKKLSWMYCASKALLELPSTKTVSDLLEESARLELPESAVMSQIRDLAAAATSWESKARVLLEHGGGMHDFIECIRAATSIQVAMNGLYELKSAIHSANDWLGRAQPLLSEHSNASVQECAESAGVDVLQALVVESKGMSVKLQEAEALASMLSGIEAWICKGNDLEEFARMELGHAEECGDGISRMEDLVKKLGKCVKEGLRLGCRIPEVARLHQLLHAMKWNIKANLLLLSEPTMKEVKNLLVEGKEIAVPVAKLERLKSAMTLIEAWLVSTSLVLPALGSKSRCTEGQLEQLLCEAENFDRSLHVLWSSEFSRLRQVLMDHRTWQREVLEILGGSSAHLSWSDLIRLQADGQINPVENKEMELLNAELVEGGLWISRCFKAIVGRSACGSFSLREVLLQMQKSVENALQQVGTDDTRGDRPFVCICQDSTENSINNLLHCDSCEDWYHPSCLGLMQAQTRGHKQYICPFCTAVCTGVLTLNEDAYAKILVTRKPTLALLGELLGASRSVNFRMQEIELLEGVIQLVEAWQARLRGIIGPALVQCNFGTDVDSCALLAALKAEGAMEVQDDEGAKISIAVAANAWRMRARKMLHGPSKPYLRSLSRAVKEALSITISSEDCVLKELRELEVYAFQWAARAKEASADLGEIPIGDIHDLIAEGESLPVAFTKELTALKARSVLYCVCQKPYDEDRAMIACDRCSEWYHFSCLDLPEPENRDDEPDQVLGQECHESGEFICPKCRGTELEKAGEPSVELDNRSDLPLDEGLAIPQAVRGKRSSRNGGRKSKSSVPQKWRGQISAPSSLQWELQRGNDERSDSAETSVSPSGRPCRRTAGRHSGFESFVLLNVRSR